MEMKGINQFACHTIMRKKKITHCLIRFKYNILPMKKQIQYPVQKHPETIWPTKLAIAAK